MNSFYAYIRVSTARQGEQGVSLPEQRSAIERYALQHDLTISRWFEERHTAAIQGRPGFDQMLELLHLNRAAGVIIHKIDRSARNLGDWNEVTELLDRGFDVRIAHDGLDLKSRSGRLTGDILAVVASDFSRNQREETIKGLNGRLKQGLFPRPAPVGYLNCGGGQPKAVDPVAGPLVRQLFELYSTGRFSLKALVGEAQTIGLRGRSGKPLCYQQVSRILHNPFYAGVIRIEKSGDSFAGIHERLVSASLFERVQQILSGKAPRRILVHDFAFRRLLQCSHCERTLSGELQKGRVYYRCQTPTCPTTTVREDVVEAHLDQLFRPLSFIGQHRQELLAEARSLDGDEHRGDRQLRQVARLRVANISNRLHRLTNAYLEGSLDKADFDQRKTALLMERRDAEERLTEDDGPSVLGATADYLELAERLYLLHEWAGAKDRRVLVEILTSNRRVSGRNPMFALDTPFAELASSVEKQYGEPLQSAFRTRSAAKALRDSLTNHLESERGQQQYQRVHDFLTPKAA